MNRPYCGALSNAAANVLHELGLEHRRQGTVVVIQGPRFSTVAESKMFMLWGGDIVNMTQYPECYFARELGLRYTTIASVTDYDVGIQSDIAITKENFERVLPVFRRNIETTHSVLARILQQRGRFDGCECAQADIRTYYNPAL
jgi:5'-methylthioadenosine phosphorylase